MKVNFLQWSPIPWLPWIVVISIGVRAYPQIEPRHNTCENEQRYENQAMCVGKQFGALVPYPDNCSQYLVCDCLYPTVMQCPANLWFDNSTKNCNYPQGMECIFYTFENAESSTEIITEATTPAISTPKWAMTTTSQDTESSSSNWEPSVPPPGIPEDFCRDLSKDLTVHRYPYNCNAYVNCTTGYPVLNYCEEDKWFNELLAICDTPDSVSGCEELPLPTSTMPISSTATPRSTTMSVPTTTEDDGGLCAPAPEYIADDYCQSLGNGFYPYAYDCHGYITCKNGCTYLDYCIADTLFNSWLYICDTPNAVDCDPWPYPTTSTTGQTTESTSTLGTSTTESTAISTTTTAATSTISTTTAAPVTLPPDVNPDDCKYFDDGQLIPYAGNCSQYLYCENHKVKLGDCPASMLFNPDLMCCDESDDVYCYGDRTTITPTTIAPTTTTTIITTPSTTTTIRPTTTTTKATTLGPDELCANAEQSTFFPYPEDCTRYYICLGEGRWYLARCLSGYFDPATGECGPEVSPTACKEQDTTTSPATTVTTTEATTTTTTTTTSSSSSSTTTTEAATTTTLAPSSGGICSEHDLDDMVAYPNNCRKYIVCRSPIPIAFNCPDGSYYSSELQQCASWEDSDCDKDESSTTPSPGYTPAPTMCTNSSRESFPYPENCQWFIRCVDDYIYMMDVCNCGEYYDPITERCGPDVPSDACRWDYTSTTTASPPPTTITTTAATTPIESSTAVTRPPPQKGPCDGADDGQKVPYPNDCTKYIQCSRPIAVSGECKPGDEFSVQLGECIDADLAGCSVTTTKKPSTTPGASTTNEASTPTITTLQPSTTPEESSTSMTTTTETSTDFSTESTTEKTTEVTTGSSTESTSSSFPGSTTDSTTTTTKEPSGGGICHDQPVNGTVPYPNNCSKYIVCLYPIPVGYDCPEGLEFSPTELDCMDPERAKCSLEATTAASTTETTNEPSSTESSTTSETSTMGSTTSKPSSTTESTTPEPSSTTESTTAEPTSTTESTTAEPSSTTETSTTESTTPEPSSTIESTTAEPSSTETSTTESTTHEPSSTTESTTPEPTSTTESTTAEPTSTTETSTTESTTPEPSSTTESTTSKPSSTTESTTPEPSSTTESSTSEPSSTTISTTSEPTTTTLDPNTSNICCGYPLGTFLPYPNDCSRYVICDYPIPYAVYCIKGTFFDEQLQQCTETANENCFK